MYRDSPENVTIAVVGSGLRLVPRPLLLAQLSSEAGHAGCIPTGRGTAPCKFIRELPRPQAVPSLQCRGCHQPELFIKRKHADSYLEHGSPAIPLGLDLHHRSGKSGPDITHQLFGGCRTFSVDRTDVVIDTHSGGLGCRPLDDICHEDPFHSIRDFCTDDAPWAEDGLVGWRGFILGRTGTGAQGQECGEDQGYSQNHDGRLPSRRDFEYPIGALVAGIDAFASWTPLCEKVGQVRGGLVSCSYGGTAG